VQDDEKAPPTARTSVTSYDWWVRFRCPIELAPTPAPRVSTIYLKRVQLALLTVPVINHAASFDSSARISCLLRIILSSEGCCATSVNVQPPAQPWPEALSPANGALNVEPR
jgi:hypothetical protein